jgi:TonB family protein
MDAPEPDTPEGGSARRGVDIAIWCLVIAAMVALAAGIAWFLANARFEIREIAFEDQVKERTLIEPVLPTDPRPRANSLPAPPPAPVTSIGPNGEVVTHPVWLRVPTPEFPEPAARRGVQSGAVALRCEGLASGELGACEVLSERPSGVGFAEAALQGARRARLRPRSIDGVATDATVQYTVRFRMAPEP